MSSFLLELKGENICDVGCGTGRLILSYLDLIGPEQSRKLINDGHLFLYDLDNIALEICKTAILIKYGLDLEPYINVICGDFLDKNIKLPKNCKVISNPPYSTIKTTNDSWKKSEVILRTKEIYAGFFEKKYLHNQETQLLLPHTVLFQEESFILLEKL